MPVKTKNKVEFPVVLERFPVDAAQDNWGTLKRICNVNAARIEAALNQLAAVKAADSKSAGKK